MALQIVAEKPQPPAWKSIGFDDNHAAVVYKHRETGQRVLWSATPVIHTGPKISTRAAMSALTITPQTREQIMDKLRADGYDLSDRLQCQALSGALYNLKHNHRAIQQEDGRWVLAQDPLAHIKVGSRAALVLEAVCDGFNRPSDIAKKLNITAKNASANLATLQQSGFVSRTRLNQLHSRYQPTEKGIAKNKPLRTARLCRDVKLTRLQERALLAIAAGNTQFCDICRFSKANETSLGATLRGLVIKKLVTREPGRKYAITKDGRVIAKALR